MTCGIYKITNTLTGEFYIGQSPDIEARWKIHKNAWANDVARLTGIHLLKSVKFHGAKNFQFEIVEICESHLLRSREAELLRTLRPVLNAYPCRKKTLKKRGKTAIISKPQTQPSKVFLEIKPSPVWWKLNDLMERHRITNRELSVKIGRHEGSVSRLKAADKLPRLDSDDIDAIATALTELLHERGYDITISSKDLLGFDG